ncbi:MAG TPA: Glu/Leu/Phe/Val dehydrogenase dimerization domain-containing protein [Candidatus Kapabacteria bacterium]|nr:Glu/Leu/Phe/Val dehydrogenase dimerization domain-containing protein [Candidatus Kapabacteria bacterium]
MEHIPTPTHQLVIKISEPSVGLRGFIAIHNTVPGPAVGGTRMFPYTSEEEALADVLRLSEAMTYKCAVAGVRYGGGKAVIIADPTKDKHEGLLRAYARKVASLQGKFFTGEDVGMSESDVQLLLTEAPYFIGKSNFAGDPSPFAALSTFYAIQVSTKHLFGSEDLHGKAVAVKGVGKVGGELVRLLVEAGAKVTIADISEYAVRKVKEAYPEVCVTQAETIHQSPVHIYAPCALGGEFSDKTYLDVRAPIICGAANNQLASIHIGDKLQEKGILYVPDVVANAGGLIDVVDELEEGGFNKERVKERIYGLRGTLQTILDRSDVTQRSPHRVMQELVENKFMIPATLAA